MKLEIFRQFINVSNGLVPKHPFQFLKLCMLEAIFRNLGLMQENVFFCLIAFGYVHFQRVREKNHLNL